MDNPKIDRRKFNKGRKKGYKLNPWTGDKVHKCYSITEDTINNLSDLRKGLGLPNDSDLLELLFNPESPFKLTMTQEGLTGITPSPESVQVFYREALKQINGD